MNQKMSTQSLRGKESPSIHHQSVLVPAMELRKIEADDLFPCFSCFDEPGQRVNCTTCNKLGYIKGDHPMVKFADDFLTKNLTGYLQDQTDETSKPLRCQPNQSNDQLQKKTFLNLTLTRKQCRSALQSYTSKQGQSQVHCKLMKSTNPTTRQEIHYDYACNYCGTLPIRGIRYHCEQCEDFDLCQSCFSTIRTQRLQVEDHIPSHSVTKINKMVRPEDVIEKLTKCEKPMMHKSKENK